MSGACYYCGRTANRKGKLSMTDELAWLCDFHVNEVRRIQTRKGAGAGIG